MILNNPQAIVFLEKFHTHLHWQKPSFSASHRHLSKDAPEAYEILLLKMVEESFDEGLKKALMGIPMRVPRRALRKAEENRGGLRRVRKVVLRGRARRAS